MDSSGGEAIKLLDPVAELLSAELLSMVGVQMGSGLSNMTALRFVFSFHLPRPVNVCEDCGDARKQSRLRNGMDHRDRRQPAFLVVIRRQSAILSFHPRRLLVHLPHNGRRVDPATKRPHAGPMAGLPLSRNALLAEYGGGCYSGSRCGRRVNRLRTRRAVETSGWRNQEEGIHCGDIR